MTVELAQWTTFGEQLEGPNGDNARAKLIETIEAMQSDLERAFRQGVTADEAPRLEALRSGLDAARTIAEKSLKPLHFSTR